MRIDSKELLMPVCLGNDRSQPMVGRKGLEHILGVATSNNKRWRLKATISLIAFFLSPILGFRTMVEAGTTYSLNITLFAILMLSGILLAS